ncbi:protein PFC0760c [Microplitis demolitor]|uniref:protein PFC0760c n=1 Tax=Microplitis demolitor TaxID=69319 RepID=UPI00043FFF20|nr:protein PFC0760c [Microplitis demolitor]
MDNPPGKYLPSNFNIFDFFFGSPSANTLAYNSSKSNYSKSSMNIQNSHYTNEKMVNDYVNNKMNLTEDNKDKDNKEINEFEKKASNTLVQGMIGGVFDALTNVVSKITNFTSTVNRSMSVTIVPQDSCYPTEYFVRPLIDGENSVANADDSTLTNTRIRYYQNYINKSHTMETVNNLSSQRPTDIDNNYINSMWFDSMQGDNYYYHHNMNPDNLYSAQSNELELAIEESLKLMKMNCKSHDSGSAQFETDFTSTPSDFNTKIQTPMTGIPDSKSLAKVDTETMEFDDSLVDLSAEQILKVKSSSKKRRRANNNNGAAQSRGKNRRRVPLRRFAAGQLKHKKERNKHFIYSGIQDDLNTWEEEINDASDELRSIISSSDDECTDDQKKCSLNNENSCVIIEKLTFGDPPIKNIINKPIIKDAIDQTTSESFNHSNECLPPVKCDYQEHLLSECSVESEDSDVVFEDEDKDESESEIETESESESECSDDSEYDDDNDDDDDNEYSDDEFIQFEAEESSPICPKVRFNLQPTVHTIIKWNFAYRAARKGPWEQMARDRDRFQTRINSTGRIIEPVLATQHRDCIWKDRFAATD